MGFRSLAASSQNIKDTTLAVGPMTPIPTDAMIAMAWRGTTRLGAAWQGRAGTVGSGMGWLANILRRWKLFRGDEISFVGIIYLIGLIIVLLLVHVLQPDREGSGSSSRSPIHQQRSP